MFKGKAVTNDEFENLAARVKKSGDHDALWMLAELTKLRKRKPTELEPAVVGDAYSSYLPGDDEDKPKEAEAPHEVATEIDASIAGSVRCGAMSLPAFAEWLEVNKWPDHQLVRKLGREDHHLQSNEERAKRLADNAAYTESFQVEAVLIKRATFLAGRSR